MINFRTLTFLLISLLTTLRLQAQVLCISTDGKRCDSDKSKPLTPEVLASFQAFRQSLIILPASKDVPEVLKYTSDWELIEDHFDSLILNIIERFPTADLQAKLDDKKKADDALASAREKLTKKGAAKAAKTPLASSKTK